VGRLEDLHAHVSADEAVPPPWHVIPADRKWVRDALVARAMVAALEGLRLRYPKPKTDLSTIVIR
jgi:polyphosphate kinase 2 (PPK2 family)